MYFPFSAQAFLNKSKKLVAKPKDQWIRVEGTHEPIISREIWDTVVSAGGPHSKNTADQRRGFLVDDEMVLVQRVTLLR